MSRLPTPGGDAGNWGTVLNDYLSQAHNSDGSLKSSAVSSKALLIDTIANRPASGTNGQIFQATDTSEYWVWSDNASQWQLMNTPTIEHIWDRDGTTGWTRQTISTNAPHNPNTMTSANGRGRISSAVGDTGGSFREVWFKDGAYWEDSEICSMWYGPVKTTDNTGVPQLGHMHRAQVDGNGNWSGIMVDNNVIFTVFSTLNLTVWGFDGTTLTQGSAAQMTTEAQLPKWKVRAYHRFNIGVWIDQYQLDHVDGLAVGDSITFSNCNDTSFNITANILSVDIAASLITVNEPSSTTTVAWTGQFGSGAYATPTAAAQQTYPFWVKSQLIGTQLRIKAWKYTEPEPAWGSMPDNEKILDFSAESTVTTPSTASGRGKCGLIANHLHDGIYMEYGNVTMRRL